MCCGQQRKQYRTTNAARRIALPLASATERLQAAKVKFEYVGRTALTVLGATGKPYRFERPGYQIEVDLGDVNSLAAVPNLRQVTLGR